MKPVNFSYSATTWRSVGVSGGAALLLSGCMLFPFAGDKQVEAPPAPAPAATVNVPAPQAQASPTPAVRVGTSVAGQAQTFSTQIATYTAVPFTNVPGWGRDDMAQSWPAFVASCNVLTNRGELWKSVCERAGKVNQKDSAAIRAYFEREFAAYQIRDDGRRPDGVVTGYFEPEIEGARTYSPPFIYPVYGPPQDMLYLDTRRLPGGNTVVAARVDGKNVVVQQGLSTKDMGRTGIYALDLSQIVRDSIDRKARLRIDGRRLLPYYTRSEIETRGAPNAPVLAFVSDAMQLYEMQIQGSGRIRVKDGAVIRIGFAEQNGQPFRPTVAKAPGSKIRTRGGVIELDPDDEMDNDIGDVGAIRTRGFTLARPVVSGAVAVPGRKASAALAGSGIEDPSYVFFKELQASGQGGPVGALGVPLEPERSIAVDPRSTPLGYPVFVSTREPGTGAPMQRLTIAQDTGGAIRGAVRADYFFGNGKAAANKARRMKERGQLWILLPRGQVVATAAAPLPGVRTRGLANLANCLVPDDDSCAD